MLKHHKTLYFSNASVLAGACQNPLARTTCRSLRTTTQPVDIDLTNFLGRN